jgi:hypothetical protein
MEKPLNYQVGENCRSSAAINCRKARQCSSRYVALGNSCSAALSCGPSLENLASHLLRYADITPVWQSIVNQSSTVGAINIIAAGKVWMQQLFPACDASGIIARIASVNAW